MADADTIYPPNWVRIIDETFQRRPQCQLVFGSTNLGFSSATLLPVASYFCSALYLPSMYLGVACSLGFNMAVRQGALLSALDSIGPVALSGWGIGTAVLRAHGRRRVLFRRTLQVSKCMRRYEEQGFGATSAVWVSEWLRLFARQPMKTTEKEYYRDL